jgi:hypothetical protein
MVEDSDFRIEEVRSKADLKLFVRLVEAIYKDDPNWVKPLEMERLELLTPEKNPWFEHATAQFWIAYRGDRPVGRISAQVCEMVQENIHRGLGQIGMYEALDDLELSAALFGTAESWLKDQGMDRVQGPFNLSVNSECGLLIDGFDTPPLIMMGHARPYYATHFEAAGYQKAKDMFAYKLNITKGMPPFVDRVTRFGENNKRLVVRRINKRNYKAEVETFFDIFNESWSDNWGFLPFTKAEAEHAAKSMRPLIRDYMVRVCEYDGEAAAFMITLPDINLMIRDLDGRLLPFGWLKLLWRLGRGCTTGVRVPLMGVRKKYQDTRIGGTMAICLIEHCRRAVVKRGGEWGELSWILEDNLGMRNILEQCGSEIYKTYRVYEKTLD